MENHPTKHRPFGPEKHRSPGPHLTTKTNHPPKKGSFADFLIESNFAPLAFAGRCVKQFGAGAVAGFLLGAISLYGYAYFKGLPFVKTTETRTVQLRGVVRDSANKPIKNEFSVGVLAKQQGPIQNSDASFVLEVPQNSSYDVALWNGDTVKVFYSIGAEPDGNGYRLQESLPFLQAVPNANVSVQESKPGPQLAQMQVASQ